MRASDLQSLAASLRPSVEIAIRESHEFASEVVEQATSRAAGGVVTLAANAALAFGKAVLARCKSDAARKKLIKDCEAAQSTAERESAIQKWIASDPALSKSLRRLLAKRDLLAAMTAYCELLPELHLLEDAATLTNVFISPDLEQRSPEGKPAERRETSSIAAMKEGNHLVSAGAGAGKSTVCRHLVADWAREILEDADALAFDRAPIPILLEAKNLIEHECEFMEAARRTLSEQLSYYALSSAPAEIFDPYDSGFSRWRFVVDGLDEITDPEKRSKLWSAISRLGGLGDSIAFLVASRPDERIPKMIPTHFTLWHIQPLDAPKFRELAHAYIQDPDRANAFLVEATRSPLIEIRTVPLFASMAAAVYLKHGSLPASKTDLCEAIAFQLCEKAFGKEVPYPSICKVLGRLATEPKADAAVLARTFPALAASVPSEAVGLHATKRWQAFFARTGLVVFSPEGARFVHDVFRSYFLALEVADKEKPLAVVWREFDPFQLGWAFAELLCEMWDKAGADITPAVRALLSCGEQGDRSARTIAGKSRNLSARLVGEITKIILREMEDFGVKTIDCIHLTELARTHALARSKLKSVSRDHDLSFGIAVHAAECLLDAGYAAEALEGLKSVVLDREAYCGDRAWAAALLIGLDQRPLAMACLVDVAENGDVYYHCLDAAIRLLESEKSEQNRGRVVQLLESPFDDDRPSASELTRLIQIGEIDLALPILRQNAAPPSSDANSIAQMAHDEIDAAKAIAAHHNLEEGLEALRRIITSSAVSLRGQLGAISAMRDLGCLTEARMRLRDTLMLPPKEHDWYSLELLTELGLVREATNLGTALLRVALLGRANSDLRSIIDRMRKLVDNSCLARPIRMVLHATENPDLAIHLAELGFRSEAEAYVLSLAGGVPAAVKVDCADALRTMGARDSALALLRKIDRSAGARSRLAAAEILRDMGALRDARSALKGVLNDASVLGPHRLAAGERLAALGENDAVEMWEVTFDVLVDQQEDPEHRIVAAKTLLRFSQSDDYEWIGDRWEVIDQLWCIADSGDVPLNIRKSALELLIPQGEVSEDSDTLFAFLASDDVDAMAKLDLLLAFRRIESGGAKLLVKLAADHRTPLVTKIKALRVAGKESLDARFQLRKLAEDTTNPLKWRIEAAKNVVEIESHALDEWCERFSQDASLSIAQRFEALSAIGANAGTRADFARAALANPRMSAQDLLATARALRDCEELDEAHSALTRCRSVPVLSIHDLVCIAKELICLNRTAEANAILTQVVRVDEIEIEEAEDHYVFSEAAQVLQEVGANDLADELASRLLTSVVLHPSEVPGFVKAMSDILGAEKAAELAEPMLKEIEGGPGDDELHGYGWVQALAYSLDAGLVEDDGALRRILNDERRAADQRIDAAHVLYTRGVQAEDVERVSCACEVIASVKKVRFREISKGADIAIQLWRYGFRTMALRLKQELESAVISSGRDARALARVEIEMGERKEAEVWLKKAEHLPDEDAEWDWLREKLIEDVRGEDALYLHKADKFKRVYADSYDQADDAATLVDKWGDLLALKVVRDLAAKVDVRQIDAIRHLFELGLTDEAEVALRKYIDSEDIDSYWLGETMLEYGNPEEALKFFRKEAENCSPGYLEQVLRSLCRCRDVETMRALAAQRAVD